MSQPKGQLPRHRSAFAAAFLSLVFPGLGHAYAGAYARALGFAAAPLLGLSLALGIGLRVSLFELAGVALQYLWLIQLLNVLTLGYRIVAAVDAHQVATYMNALETSGGGRLGRPRLGRDPLSIAGLAAVLIVMSGVHVAVAYYDVQAQDLVNCVFDPSGTASCDSSRTGNATGSAAPSGNPSSAPSAASIAGSAAPGAMPAPAESAKLWTGGRLNILLLGVDQRPKDATFNTDTMIVASIDPTTKQVALFSLPRDTVGVPLPPGPAQAVFGATFQCKINSLWTAAQQRPDLFPGNDQQRGFLALKDTLGYVFGLDIPYYVEVNFNGFRQLVDSVGGVTINVQFPVLDDNFPGDRGDPIRVYIPAGIQHMTGAQALVYARSRHGSTDYDRSQRQQRVLLSLKDQTDVNALIPRIPDLVAALKQTVHTDIPVSQLPALLQLAGGVDTTNVRSYVFSPPLYGQHVFDTCGDSNTLYVAKVRQAVKDAFSANPTNEAQKEQVAAEGATVWVLNGSGRNGQAANVAGYLTFQGVNASAPSQQPPTSPSATEIVVYNGAEQKDPATVALLEKVFGVKATLVNDPTARVNIVVTTGRTTPDLTPPPAP
ncbi:MAG: LCP family protein [Chloroflexi bacterium]|nr:LCP family protein [Chloroflexota bacterium]